MSESRKRDFPRRLPRRIAAPLLATLSSTLLALAGGCDRDAEPAPGPVAAATRPPPPSDPRIDFLLVPGARVEHYDVDTSDSLGILTENLLHGQRDPLRRAREELGSLGAEGLGVARRVIDSHFADPDGFAALHNSLDVLRRSDEPDARELCLRMLRHPSDGLRKAAIDALEKHGRPEDYDALYEAFETIAPEFKLEAMLALEHVDTVRAHEQYLTWLENGLYEGAWDRLMERVCRSDNRVVIARISRLWPKLPLQYQAQGAAACARSGDEASLEFLRGELAAEDPGRRRAAVLGMANAGLEEEVDALARSHPDSGVRMLALQTLATPAAAPRHVEVLRTGLSSIEEEVATACLSALAAIHDPVAIERALALLAEPRTVSLVTPMNALQQPMGRDPALAQRVLDALARRRDPEAHLPLEQQVQVLRSIARVPLRAAAELLYGMVERAEGEIQGVPAQRWMLQLVGNTGEPGQRLLAEELPRATDPLRRIDLIEGLTIHGGPLALETLLALVESERCGPYELLYVADRLTRIGTVAQVAPVLKRAVLRVEQPDVRVALQSLLWFHYPAPR